MNKTNQVIAALGAILIGVGSSAGAGGKDRGDAEQDEVREALKRGELMPLSKILPIALAQVPGDVVKLEIEREHGVLIYEIKILAANGRVREVELDARTGKLIKVEDD